MPDTIAGLIRRNAADPTRTFAVLTDGTRITYADQLARSHAVAVGLRNRGVEAGERVMCRLANCREFFDLWFGTAIAGNVLVPVNPQATEYELQHIREDAEPSLEVTGADEVEALRAAGDSGALPQHDVADRRDMDLAAILYTSGTTSRAKGVMITEANYVAVGNAVAEHVELDETDRWLVSLPLFHANAQYYCVMSALVVGASIGLAPRFSASRWGDQARSTGATVASLFAAPIRMILAAPGGAYDSRNRLRLVLFAQNLTNSEATQFESRFDTDLIQLYGMTETVMPPTMNPLTGGRFDSIGRPLPGVHIDLIDADGNVSESIGEMRVGGQLGRTLAAGYWRNPEATARVFGVDGLATGDLARRDEAGLLYFVDRAKDMIKRAGENVATGEIELVAADHPAVAECAAIGVPDPVRDESILLVVVPEKGQAPTEEELISWCRQRLSAFKVPSAITFLDALPRTSVGKIRKADLRASLATSQTEHPTSP